MDPSEHSTQPVMGDLLTTLTNTLLRTFTYNVIILPVCESDAVSPVIVKLRSNLQECKKKPQ